MEHGVEARVAIDLSEVKDSNGPLSRTTRVSRYQNSQKH